MSAVRNTSPGGLVAASQPLGLPLWTRPLPEEPAHGVMMRLAEINRLSSLRRVTDETGLSMVALHRGRQFDLLAEVLRCPVAEVARWSFVVGQPSRTRIRGSAAAVVGHDFNFKNDYEFSRRRACPACLRESNHHRFWWDLSFVTTCHRHGLKLVDRCSCGSGRKLTWKDARLHRGGCCEAGDLRTTAGEAADPAILRVDAYLAGRLGTGTPVAVPLLDELPVTDAVDVLFRVGGLEATGWTTSWPSPNTIDRPQAEVRAAGYAVIAEDRIGDVLEATYQGFLKARPDDNANVTTAYGGFYHWYNLRGHQQFSKHLTEAIYGHASKTFRLDRRALRNKAIAVSETTRAQMIHFDDTRVTLKGAAEASGCHLLQVRQVAVAYGLMREERRTGHVVLLDRDDADTLAVLMRNRVSRHHAADALGIGARIVEQLVDHGLLVPVLRANRDGGSHGEFLRHDVEDFAKTLMAVCDRSSKASGRESTFLRARLSVRPDILWRSIVTGEVVARYRSEGEFTLHDVMLRERDVAMLRERSLAAGPPGEDLSAKPPFDHWRRRVADLLARGAVDKSVTGTGARRQCARPTRLVVGAPARRPAPNDRGPSPSAEMR